MLQSIRVIKSNDRNVSIDIFRAFAIIGVVLYHFNGLLPYGYLGVDLFFVISGVLIGSILLRDRQINYPKFILQRGFKIWPSYYFFLIAGNIIAYYIGDNYIHLWDAKRYLFFYQNYTGPPYHWSFGHVWSLCVEEHFYIMLPLFLIALYKLHTTKRGMMYWLVLIIILGFLLKLASLYLTRSKDTYSATHNRIDALALGVLLAYLIKHYSHVLKRYLFYIGAALMIITIVIELTTQSVFYHKVMLFTLMPISFALMIAGTYFLKIKGMMLLRVIAYYSYSWYLWHPIVYFGTVKYLGLNALACFVYLITSFLVAMIATVLVEEPALRLRSKVLGKVKVVRLVKAA